MAEPLLRALTRVRSVLLAEDTLIRAVASGRQRGKDLPWRRVELRYVDLKAGRHLQVTSYDQTQARTSNHAVGEAARAAVDDLLDLPFGNWHLETSQETVQVRVTKKGEAFVHTAPVGLDGLDQRHEGGEGEHDRVKERLLPESDPVLAALGVADGQGRVKPSRRAKYRQVEEFLRVLASGLEDLDLPAGRPLRVADLGCGNGYLTFAVHRFLTERGLQVHTTGVDVKAQALAHNTGLAQTLGYADTMAFVQASIADLAGPGGSDRWGSEPPDVVLALHACDTATDEALAAAVGWGSALVLAAPCCHHDIAAQLRRTPTPSPYALLTRHGILRERFADTLTDGLRAAVLRQRGYRVDVMEFVESRHTPRNTLIRARRTGATARPEVAAELDELVSTWSVRPRLAELLDLLDA